VGAKVEVARAADKKVSPGAPAANTVTELAVVTASAPVNT
jgi:hypothetical protein